MEEIKSETIEEITEKLCQTLNCSSLANDLERVKHAREILAKMQQNEILEQLGREGDTGTINNQGGMFQPKARLPQEAAPNGENNENPSLQQSLEDEIPEELEAMEDELSNDSSHDTWQGFFNDFEIIDEDAFAFGNANKQCIEISHDDSDSMLESHLRAGVRCFAIDLFKGTQLQNQILIYKLHEKELKISRQFGFPVTASLLAMLSPRCQYTGMFEPCEGIHQLQKNEVITLTSDRQYSTKCCREKIYVNARFVIENCQVDDFVLVGPSLQLQIISKDAGDLQCRVMQSGSVASRTPVRFPNRGYRYNISLEEIEDIVFAREVGINVIVSYIPGTLDYLEDLKKVMNLLKCQNLRLYARVVINDFKNVCFEEVKWVAHEYGGFVFDFIEQQKKVESQDHECQPFQSNKLNLTPTAVLLAKKIFDLQKPLIMKPELIANWQLIPLDCNLPEVFYYPDKYMFMSKQTPTTLHFGMRQMAISSGLSKSKLYCDEGLTESDILAKACVTASLESEAVAILVCSIIPDMAIKLSHFRPKATIFFISSTKSIADYISMYHNIVHLHFSTTGDCAYMEYITKAFMFGLLYMKSRKLLPSDKNVVLVYSSNPDTHWPDKYVFYNFEEKDFGNLNYKLNNILNS
uniref:Pyruvate kinase barrel domain-containing protein n=1 Tax=Stomoxys calcitrans TaxID=35570 RepID=A0A1I8NLJ8_STOCA